MAPINLGPEHGILRTCSHFLILSQKVARNQKVGIKPREITKLERGSSRATHLELKALRNIQPTMTYSYAML